MTLSPPLFLEKLGYTAMQERQVYNWLLHAGVFGRNPGEFTGTPYNMGTGAGMNSSVSEGNAAVKGSFQFRQGLYIVENSGQIEVAHPTADPTNPRLDQLALKVYDSTDGGDASDTAALLVVPGTPTAGTTLTNRNGAAALPTNSLRLADVLIPAKATKAAGEFTYRDRRPWAQGFQTGISGGFVKLTESFQMMTATLALFEFVEEATLRIMVPLHLKSAPTEAGNITFRFVVDGATGYESIFAVTVGGTTEFTSIATVNLLAGHHEVKCEAKFNKSVAPPEVAMTGTYDEIYPRA